MAQTKLDRRRFLIGTAVAGATGSVARAAATSTTASSARRRATYRGAVPWQEGAADARPA